MGCDSVVRNVSMICQGIQSWARPPKIVGSGGAKAYCPVVDTYCCEAEKPGASGVPTRLLLAPALIAAAIPAIARFSS